MRSVSSLVLFSVLSGCLGSTYDVPHEELSRLATADPSVRGEQVRVVQDFVTADEPPRAPVVSVHTGVVFYAAVPVHHHGRSARGASRGVNIGGAEDSADAAVVGVVLASLAAVGLAATEGARYDGWVRLHPMHPVHVRLLDGRWGWIPLAQLTPDVVAATEEAVVYADEGPWQELGRAPLDRVGFTYVVELGVAGLDSVAGDRPPGFMGRIQFGGFPIQQLGILANVGLGWSENADSEVIFNGRYGLELDAYPFRVGVLSMGTYAQGGGAHAEEDLLDGRTASRWVPYFGGGVLFQLELTTRLALTLRGGATAIVDDIDGAVALPEGSIGLAIY